MVSIPPIVTTLLKERGVYKMKNVVILLIGFTLINVSFEAIAESARYAIKKSDSFYQEQFGKIVDILVDEAQSSDAANSSEIDQYKKTCRQGGVDACFKLGQRFQSGGKGVYQNRKRAAHWFEKAANLDHDISQMRLGLKFRSSKYGVEKNDEKSSFWLEKAKINAEKGVKNTNADSHYVLAVLYANGYAGLEKDKDKALSLFQKAAELGSVSAQYIVGNRYMSGTGVTKDIHKAIHWFEKAAHQGNARAQNSLGNIYKTGQGVMPDIEQAFFWYEKARDNGGNSSRADFLNEALEEVAENNPKKFIQKVDMSGVKSYEQRCLDENASSCFILGNAYFLGAGIKKNYKESIKWLEKAAIKKHKRAQYTLGFMYEKGWGVKYDLEQAFIWYEQAAQLGSEKAKYKLGNFYTSGRGVDKDMKQAFIWYEKAAKDGYIKAQNKVGDLYRHGRGVEKKHDQAVFWYQEGVNQGDLDSLFKLADIYRFEKKAESTALMEKAADKGHPEAQIRQAVVYLSFASASRKTLKSPDKEKAYILKAVDLIKNAYKNGDFLSKDSAKFLMVEIDEQGFIVNTADQQAMFLLGLGRLSRAADSGNSDAQYKLGLLLEHGKGEKQNKYKAERWYKKASLQEHKKAKLKLGID